MAGLRNIFDAQNPHLLTQEQVDLGAAAGMNPLMQGYQSGRLSNEANYQLSQQMALREANNETAAAALQPKINALRQRASIYAPSVQKVEDINGIGSGLTWLGGQVGQGAASMQDPLLASAALTGVGTGLSFMPNPIAKGAGFLLRNVAAPGVAYGINREQLKGEQYGNLLEDPTVMAGHTPQEIASQVGDYANVAGLLDTAIPGMVGRQLGGGALRGAVSKFSPAAKAGMGLVGEGLTETAQEALAKQQHTGLNPNRDTSGDMSDLINSFAGGMAGAGGPVMAGGAAEAGFRGIRRGAEGVGQAGKVVTDAAGKAIDMLAPKAEPYISKAAEGLRQAKEMATGKVVDLKGQFQQMSQNRAEAHAEDELIAGEPPKGMDLQSEDFRKWVTESHPQRVQAIVNRLGRLQDAGDQTAGQLLERIGQSDEAAIEEGAAHALKQGRLEEVLADYSGKAGGLAASTGRFLKGAATRVAAAAKAGFQKGRKLNAQDPEQSAWTGDEYERRKGEAMASLGDLMATHMSQEAQAAPAVQGLPEAKRQNLSRAAAEMARQLADIAHNWTPGTKKPSVQQFDRMQNDLSRIARHMVSIYGERAPDVAERLQSFADPKTKAVFGHLQDAISKDSVSRGSVTETKAWQVLKSSIPTEKQAELARDGIDLTAPSVRRSMMAMIEAAANGQLTPQARRQLSGLLGADGLQKVVEAYHPVPDAAKRLDEAWSTAEDSAEDKTPTTSDEDTTDNEGSDFEKRQGEKALAKRGNERVYGLLGMTPMSDTMLAGGRRDPMAFSGAHRPRLYDLRTTAEQDPRATPEELAGRQAQLAKDTERMQQHVGASGETDWGVSTRSALDELAGRMGVDPKKALSALDDEGGRGSIDPQFAEAMLRQYRDHMRDLHRRAANSNDPTFQGQAKGFEARAENADLVLKDRAAMRRYAEDDVMINQRAAQTARARVEAGLPVGKFERKGLQLQTSPGDRIDMLKKARAFLSTHGVIVAERATQRDIERITPAQVTELVRSGRALLQAHPDTLRADTEWDHERLGSPKNDVLRFRSAEKVDKNGDPELVPIRGRDLAALGRRARLQQGDEREGNANARYIEDLSSGIAALIDTGLVKGLPEGFNNGSLPESLPLDNISFKNFKFGKEKAVERAKERLKAFDPYEGEEGKANDARTGEEHQERVEKDQDHDHFAPGDDESLVAEEAAKKSAKADERVEQGKRSELTHEADKSEQEAHAIATRAEGFGATSRRGSEEMPKAFNDKQKLDALLASGDWKKLLGAKPELKARFEAAALKRREELSEAGLKLNFQQRRALKVLSEMKLERPKPEKTAPKDFGPEVGKLVDGKVKLNIAAAKEDAAPLGKSQDRRSGAGKNQARDEKRVAAAGEEMSRRITQAAQEGTISGEFLNAQADGFVRAGAYEAEVASLRRLAGELSALVAGKHNMGGTAQATVDGWAARFAGGEKVTVARLPADSAYMKAVGAQHGEFGGAYTKIAGQHFILTGSYRDKVSSLNRLAHEFGHALQRIRFDNAPEKVQEQIRAAWERDIESDDVMRFMSPARYATDETAQLLNGTPLETDKDARRVVEKGAVADAEERAENDPAFAEYLASFHEWFAEQFSKYVTHDFERNVPPAVRSFWRNLIDAFKRYFNAVIAPAEPNKDFAAWVDSLAGPQRKLNAQRPTYETFRSSLGELDWSRASFPKEAVGPVEQAQISTQKNVAGDEIALRVFDRALRTGKEHGGHVLSLKLFKDDGKWHIAVDGPEPGTKAFNKYQSMLTVLTAGETNPYGYDVDPNEHGYTKFKPGAFTDSVVRKLFRLLRDHAAEMGVDPDEVVFGRETGANAGKPDVTLSRAQLRKLNAQALQHHAESGNLGFGAAHNSPHRFPSFNWREHLGSGAGSWVKGAGTYLSTAEAVHAYYKHLSTSKINLAGATQMRQIEMHLKTARQEFGYLRNDPAAQKGVQARIDQLEATYAQIKKAPTYHVSVDIDRSRLLNWDQPLSKQSKTIQLRAMKAMKDNGIEGGLSLTGEDLYRELAQKMGDMPKASDYLQNLGIMGHEYAANGGKENNQPNYVIYDDSKIKINYVAFNGQNPSSNASTQVQMEEAKAYLNKILPDVHVAFKEIFGDDGTPVSGEWVKSQNTVFVSTMAGANTLSVAYHEGLHAFFSKFVEHDERTKQILMSLADDKKVLARLEALLAQHPAALSQLVDGEERLAYIYQFWASGMLELPRQPRTVFEKIKRFFARVFAQITDQDRAVAILDALHTGKLGDPSVAGQVIAKAKMEGMLTTQIARKVDALVAKVQNLTVPANSMLEMSDSETARKLAMMMWTNPGNEEHGKAEQEGYLNARSAVATKYTNEFKGYLKDLNDTDLKQINEYLQQGVDATTIPFAPHQDAVNKIRALNKRFYRYMTDERGMQLGKFDPDRYFPRVWDASKLVGNGEDFVKMLMTHYKARIGSEENARALLDLLIRNSLGERVLPERMDGVLAPFFASEENRKLAWIEPHHSAEFQTKNLIHTLSTYYHNGARAAEYTHRFGQRGEKLEGMLEDVHKELVEASKKLVARQEFKTQAEADKWRQRRYEQVVKAVGAMEGTLGSDINSAWRNASVWTTVYQNVRLLPLALFSNMVDPLALVARGGTMSDAYDTFLRGMTQVIHNWKDMLSREPKERQADAWERMAEAMGTVDAAMFSHHVADEYSSMYMSTKAKAVNETFFRANGMEAWNRGVRVGATRAAVNFLTRHAKLPDVHSARWLTELGLAPSDLTFDAGGQLILDKNVLAKQKGIPIAQAEVEMEKVHAAVRRWVQGAVITPNAAQRPSWSSDPHYSMFFHLKQFSYSFHQTILKRAVKELEYGNLAPLGSFIWYVPVMMAADITRGLIQGGGQLPAYMKGMTASDWVLRSASRSGLLSVGEIGVNAASDLASLGGPAVEQVIDGFSQPIGRTVVDALPASPLVKHLGGR